MHIREASIGDIPEIHRIAHETWWPTYESFLTAEQISFMLKDMYSEAAIEQQMKEGINFIIAIRNDVCVAFAAYSVKRNGEQVCRIEKLYILPTEQGKGTGTLILEHMSVTGQKLGCSVLELNVNRSNPALEFYKKSGFEIHRTVDIPYHHFTLNDYIMRRQITP